MKYGRKFQHCWGKPLHLRDDWHEGGGLLQNLSLHYFIAAEDSSFATAVNPLSQ